MSSRNIRKLLGGNVLPPPDDSDSDYEPYNSRQPSKSNTYAGLVASSDSTSEEDTRHDAEAETSEVEPQPSNSNSNNKTKKRKKSKKSKKKSNNVEELDEIDKSIKEVNDMLGALPMPNIEKKPPTPTKNIFLVENKHLNVDIELRRVFGPDEEKDANKRRGRNPHIQRLSRRGLIVHLADKFENLPKVGLTMSVDRRENDVTYFVFNHGPEYQRTHRQYVERSLYEDKDSMLVPINNALRLMHVEQLVEGANMMFRFEEYTEGRSLLEQAIVYLQYVSHPSFRLSDPNTRLEYKYMENRVFFVSVLMYLHMLTNSASHRTALELAKMLLNLDPSDPLAMIFIIDTLAIRAKEYQWLIDAFKIWQKERQADYVFNLVYSHALAHFHIARSNHGDMSRANTLLQTAIIRFPYMINKLLEVTKTKNEDIQNHDLYKLAEEWSPKYLREMIHVYAKFSGAKWREPAVMAWLLKNATAVIEKFENNSEVKAEILKWNEQRMLMFRGAPGQVIRHLGVIKYMAHLIFDEALPAFVPRNFRAGDPQPWPNEDNINRYNYQLLPLIPSGVPGHGMFQFFVAMRPGYRPPPEAQRQPGAGHQGQQGA